MTDGTNSVSHVDNIEGIIDGQANDTFVFEDGAVFNGTIGASNEWFGVLGFNQGAGLNTFDFSAYTKADRGGSGLVAPGFDLLTYPATATAPATDTGAETTIVPTFFNVHRVISGQGDDTLYGSMNDDVLDGGPGNDTLYGRDGVDTLIGGTGDDSLNGAFEDELCSAIVGLFITSPTS